MVIDHIEHLGLYQTLNKHISTCIEYMIEHDLKELKPGKYEVDGKNAYLMINEYEPQEEIHCAFEGHQKYADIQIILEGDEYFGYQYRSHKFIDEVTVLYKDETDYEKYILNDYTKFKLNKGMFALVFPEDLHMPNIKKESAFVKKAVFKILVK